MDQHPGQFQIHIVERLISEQQAYALPLSGAAPPSTLGQVQTRVPVAMKVERSYYMRGIMSRTKKEQIDLKD